MKRRGRTFPMRNKGLPSKAIPPLIALLAGTILALSWYHLLLRSYSADDVEASYDEYESYQERNYALARKRSKPANEEIYLGDAEGVNFNKDLHKLVEQGSLEPEEDEEPEDEAEREEDPDEEEANSDKTPGFDTQSEDSTPAFTVDDSIENNSDGPPRATILAGPVKLSRDTRPVIKFGGDRPDRTFQIKLDSSAWIKADSPLRFRQPLADGTHTFQVAALDNNGNREDNPSKMTWRVDATAPKTTIEAFPSDPSNRNSATFDVKASEKGCSFPYSIDMRPKGEVQWSSLKLESHVRVKPLTVHKVRVDIWNLTDAQYRFNVAARDEAGNSAKPLVFVWTVDLQPPETIIHAGPRRLSKWNSAEFIVSAAGDDPGTYIYQYRLDGGIWKPGKTDDYFGDGYRFKLTELKEGPRVIEIRTMDNAGNIDPTPARYDWTIHVKAADTFIVKGPPERSNAKNATITISCSETQYTYAYKLDNGPVVRPMGHKLVSGKQSFLVEGLENGPHSVAVRSTDVTGAEDPTPAVFKWTVDLVPPVMQMVSRPPDITVRKDAVFVVNCSEAYTAKYKLDGREWDSIDHSGRIHVGPMRFRVSDLYEGKHQLDVLGTDQAGNDGEVLTLTWVIDVGPPKTKIKSTPEKHAHSHESIFHLQNSEADCMYEFRLDRGRWRSAHKAASDAKWIDIPSEKTISGGKLILTVAAGFHLIQIRSKDAAGTKDTEPAEFEWVVY